MYELVSKSRIPCKVGKNREFARKRADFAKNGARSCSNFKALVDEFQYVDQGIFSS